MKLNNDDNWTDKLEEATNEHAKKIVESDTEEVAMFIQRVTNSILDQIDQIKDDDLAIELTAFLGGVLGGMSKGILDLKLEVLRLRRLIIDKKAGKQDSELN
ncbi:MAG: hypothetical protein P8P37_01705 [Candidatus Marinimicrobia bacterium]|nr:hypothetical protein [Candidatus Neomarinimicrobiota bacterium]